MAIIEFIHPAKGYSLSLIQTVEVRVWGRGGSTQQIFYTRSFIQHAPQLAPKKNLNKDIQTLQAFRKGQASGRWYGSLTSAPTTRFQSITM